MRESKNPEIYQRRVLYKNHGIEVVLIEWSPGATTPFHDHGTTRGVVAVLEGKVTEELFSKGDKKFLGKRIFGAGDVFFENENFIHRVMNLSPTNRAVTTHTYFSKLEMKEYCEEELRKEKV